MKEPKEDSCNISYFSEDLIFVHTQYKMAKIFETSNINISVFRIKAREKILKSISIDEAQRRERMQLRVKNALLNMDENKEEAGDARLLSKERVRKKCFQLGSQRHGFSSDPHQIFRPNSKRLKSCSKHGSLEF